MSKFLDHFPTIDYPGLGRIKDITAGIRLSGVQQTVPYQQPAGLRPDVIATKYYGDPVMEWLLFLANEVDNPRDLIYLTEQQFTDMIIRKYQSVERAQKLTKFYRHNWRDVTTSSLSVVQYDSLPAEVRPLFDVKRDYKGDISGYVRKQVDVTRSTNLIYQVEVEDASSLSQGEPVTFEITGAQNGRGVISIIDGNTVFVEHITDDAVGTELTDGTNTVAIVSIALATENITAAEAPYYERISMYDFLYELNELRREMVVIDKRQTQQLERQLEQAFG